jgi:hypothetical protein
MNKDTAWVCAPSPRGPILFGTYICVSLIYLSLKGALELLNADIELTDYFFGVLRRCIGEITEAMT